MKLMQEFTSRCSFALIVPNDPHNSSHRQNKNEGKNDIKTKDKSGIPEQVRERKRESNKDTDESLIGYLHCIEENYICTISSMHITYSYDQKNKKEINWKRWKRSTFFMNSFTQVSSSGDHSNLLFFPLLSLDMLLMYCLAYFWLISNTKLIPLIYIFAILIG